MRKAGATGAPLAVVFFDVDRLVTVNRFFGHRAGAAALRAVAAHARGRLRPATS